MCALCCLYLCSLPRHKVSGVIKGFSFVEYATTEEANTALEVCLLSHEIQQTSLKVCKSPGLVIAVLLVRFAFPRYFNFYIFFPFSGI